MNDFRRGRTRLLVSTSVVEVGVDVPNASLILVFNAERFGLAQLHQLRGRVGRASHHSYCVLVCSDHAEGALERLQVLERTRDGFAIAEADLTLRGPGELLGQKQSGLPGLRLGDLAADAPLVHHARALAKAVLRADPDLSTPPNQAARRLLAQTEPQAAAN
jgi:ATP-dependent DNA helicase RecG